MQIISNKDNKSTNIPQQYNKFIGKKIENTIQFNIENQSVQQQQPKYVPLAMQYECKSFQKIDQKNQATILKDITNSIQTTDCNNQNNPQEKAKQIQNKLLQKESDSINKKNTKKKVNDSCDKEDKDLLNILQTQEKQKNNTSVQRSEQDNFEQVDQQKKVQSLIKDNIKKYLSNKNEQEQQRREQIKRNQELKERLKQEDKEIRERNMKKTEASKKKKQEEQKLTKEREQQKALQQSQRSNKSNASLSKRESRSKTPKSLKQYQSNMNLSDFKEFDDKRKNSLIRAFEEETKERAQRVLMQLKWEKDEKKRQQELKKLKIKEIEQQAKALLQQNKQLNLIKQAQNPDDLVQEQNLEVVNTEQQPEKQIQKQYNSLERFNNKQQINQKYGDKNIKQEKKIKQTKDTQKEIKDSKLIKNKNGDQRLLFEEQHHSSPESPKKQQNEINNYHRRGSAQTKNERKIVIKDERSLSQNIAKKKSKLLKLKQFLDENELDEEIYIHELNVKPEELKSLKSKMPEKQFQEDLKLLSLEQKQLSQQRELIKKIKHQKQGDSKDKIFQIIPLYTELKESLLKDVMKQFQKENLQQQKIGKQQEIQKSKTNISQQQDSDQMTETFCNSKVFTEYRKIISDQNEIEQFLQKKNLSTSCSQKELKSILIENAKKNQRRPRHSKTVTFNDKSKSEKEEEEQCEECEEQTKQVEIKPVISQGGKQLFGNISELIEKQKCVQNQQQQDTSIEQQVDRSNDLQINICDQLKQKKLQSEDSDEDQFRNVNIQQQLISDIDPFDDKIFQCSVDELLNMAELKI